MFGDKAYNLIKNLRMSREIVPMFDDDGVRQVLKEIEVLYAENCKVAAQYSSTGDESGWTLLRFRHSAIMRNKRCLLAYLHNRMEKVKSMRWEFGPVIPQTIQKSLCQPEVTFFHDYTNSLANYMKSVGNGDAFDLTTDLVPPKSLCIEVRCVEDYGKFELDDGQIILLKKNSIHRLPRAASELLIRQGYLEHLT